VGRALFCGGGPKTKKRKNQKNKNKKTKTFFLGRRAKGGVCNQEARVSCTLLLQPQAQREKTK
jgi:hypothetical protein